MRYLNTVCGIIISSLISISSASGQDTQPPPPGVGFPDSHGIPGNSKAPDFEYPSLDGQEIKLSNYRGQFVLLDFWGTWCKPCLEDTPYLKEAFSKYGGQVKIIGIAVNNRKQSVIDYVEANNLPWPQIFVPFESKESAGIIEQYNVRGYPSLFLIDPNGVVQIGAQSREDIDRLRGDALLETLDKVLN